MTQPEMVPRQGDREAQSMDFEASIRTSTGATTPGRDLTFGRSAPRQVGSFAAAINVFKKTSDVADLKPAGRDLAKDLLDYQQIPLLTKPLLDHDDPCGDLTVSGRTFAAPTSGPWNPHQQGDCIGSDAVAAGFDANLTALELAARQTGSRPDATHPTAGLFWKYAHQAGPASDGAATGPGNAHENQCYADS